MNKLFKCWVSVSSFWYEISRSMKIALTILIGFTAIINGFFLGPLFLDVNLKSRLMLVSVDLFFSGLMFRLMVDIIEISLVKVNKTLRNISLAVYFLGTIGIAIFAFLIYYENNAGFNLYCFVISEIMIVYSLNKDVTSLDVASSFVKFCGIMLICVVIYGIIYYIKGDYPDGLIMSIGYYVAAIVLTKWPENLIKKWLAKRNKKIEKIAIEKATKARNESYKNVDLFTAMSVYLHFSELYCTIYDSELDSEKTKLMDFYLGVCLYKTGLGEVISSYSTERICQSIAYCHYRISSKFLHLVIDQCIKNDLIYLIFTTTNKLLNAKQWPVIFKNDSEKAAHVELYLNTKKSSCDDELFKSSTKNFHEKKLSGLFNCLSHYRDNVTEPEKRAIAQAELQRLYDFAVECSKKMDIDTEYNSKKRLERLINFQLKGLLRPELVFTVVL